MEPILQQRMRTRPVVVLTGARQTGKTALVRRLFSHHPYVSLDLPSEAEQAEREPARFLERHPSPLVVDEVQYAPGLLRHLKRAVDARRDTPGQFLLTGSQPFEVMAGVTESLAGRAAVLHLSTLSYAEVRRALPETSVEDMVVGGGFPELYEKPDLDARGFFQSYVATYLERDLRAQLQVGSLRDFERFLRDGTSYCRAAQPGRVGTRRGNQSIDGGPVALGPGTLGSRDVARAVVLQPHEVAGQDSEAPLSRHGPVCVFSGNHQPRRLDGLAACRRALGVDGLRGARAIDRDGPCLGSSPFGGTAPRKPTSSCTARATSAWPTPSGVSIRRDPASWHWCVNISTPPLRAPSSAARLTATRLRSASRHSPWPISRPSSRIHSRDVHRVLLEEFPHQVVG